MMSRLEVGTEVWADIAQPHNIALSESEGRPGVVVYVQPRDEPFPDDQHPEYGWNGDDVFVKWNGSANARSYQYKHVTPFNPDDELDWDYEEQDPLYGDKPWISEERPTGTLAEAYRAMHKSAYLDELRVRYQRINDGLFALSQVDVVYPDTLDKVRSARDYVAGQIREEESKLNG